MLEKDLINTYVKCLGGIISEEGEEVVEQETDEIEETVTFGTNNCSDKNFSIRKRQRSSNFIWFIICLFDNL
jgi:hypothetical protein